MTKEADELLSAYMARLSEKLSAKEMLIAELADALEEAIDFAAGMPTEDFYATIALIARAREAKP